MCEYGTFITMRYELAGVNMGFDKSVRFADAEGKSATGLIYLCDGYVHTYTHPSTR